MGRKAVTKQIDFGRSSSVSYEEKSDGHEETSIDLSGVQFVIQEKRRKEFQEALTKLINDFFV